VPDQLHLFGAGGGPSRPRPTKPRERDELWEAVLCVCRLQQSSMTASSRSITNRAVKEIRATGATPGDVLRRSRVYVEKYRQTPTAQALARQWPGLAESPLAARRVQSEAEPPLTPERRAEVASRLRAWMDERR
jgi:hypothetical protein